MLTLTNQETGEMKEMSEKELMDAMREGTVTVQRQVHHADGTVTSSVIYGNVEGAVNVFGTTEDILKPAILSAQKRKDADKSLNHVFHMDDSDADYEVTIDDTALPAMYIVSCSKEGVTVSSYVRDERRTVGKPISQIMLPFENSEITATLENVQENNLILFAFAVYEIRKVLKERGMLQKLQDIGNKSAGILVTVTSENQINARIVCGKARPDLPCMMLGGAFATGIEEAVMMRPYSDEMISEFLCADMSTEEKIAAAEKGDTEMMNEVALSFLMESDGENAAYWFQKSAEVGDPVAMFNLSLLYAKGFGVAHSIEKAAYWMQQAADNGDEDAPALIEKFAKAQNAEKAAGAGNAQAQAELAEFYMFMENSVSITGPEKDYAMAFEYAQKSAAQNNGDGIWVLALCYEHGRGVEEDVAQAVALYRKGAELGHAPSQHSLACYMMRGDYLANDDETAFSLFEQAAMQGYKLAEFSLCKMYELGRGTEANLAKAIEWGEKAATGGSANTQYEVAKLYTYTTDDREMIDVERARYWYTQAAAQGHEMAAAVLNLPPYNENSEEAELYQAVEDVLYYENELQSSGLLPDAPSAYDAPGAFYRVRSMAENGDEKAIALLAAFEAFFPDDE